MLNSLQRRWKVSGWQFILVIGTFALGGSVTGYAARKLMPLFAIDNPVLWIIGYLLLVTILWPLAVLIISIPFGQYSFFIKYIRKIGARMGILKSSTPTDLRGPVTNNQSSPTVSSQRPIINIALFASGAGSNAQKIIEHFRHHPFIKIRLIVCNKPGAGVLQIAKDNGIESWLVDKEKFFRGNAYTGELKEKGVDFIVLAGFLWKIPPGLINAYQKKIINIHPALLPKYGGKGMYGQLVHETVLGHKEKESGISIHYVDEFYDHGQTIFQTNCPVYENDTAQTLAQRIHQLEYRYYPGVIEELLSR